MIRYVKVIAVSLSLALAVTACGDGDRGRAPQGRRPDPPRQLITVTADESSWNTTGATSLESGWVSIAFETLDEGSHGLALVRLASGVTMDRLVEFIQTPQSEDLNKLAELATLLGGFVGVSGPETNRMTIRLEPGSYGMLDFGGDKGPNFLEGMLTSFQVAAEDAGNSPPASDGEIVMTEFSVDLPEGFAGRGTYLVRNDGALFHELNLGEVPQDVDLVAEVKKTAKTGRGKLDEVTGLFGMAPGTNVYFDLDFSPGRYVALCLLPDPPEQGPHALRGMWTEFAVD